MTQDSVGAPWEEGSEPSIARPSEVPSSADVVVIGGGIVGAASAYELARRGRSVVLLEKGAIAGEQSGRNWGWVRQQARDEDELPLMQAANALWRNAEQELEADIEWSQGGNLAIATDPARIAFFREWAGLAESAGLETRLLDGTGIRSLLPKLAGDWLGAMYTPSDGHAEPAKATRAFARAAKRHGAVIVEGCVTDRILVERGRVVGVTTEAGPIRSPAVICAAGVWSARLLRPIGIDLPIRIVRSTVARTRPIEPLTDIAVSYHPVVSFRQRRDGRLYLAAGGWSDYDVTLDSFRHLREFLPNYVKNRRMIRIHVGRGLVDDLSARLSRRSLGSALRGARILSPEPNRAKVATSLHEFERMFPDRRLDIERAWAGYTDTTPDAIPVIDAPGSPAGLVIATGFSGHGFGMGPIVGRLVAELVVDGQPSLPLTAFRLGRFADGTFKKPRLVA